MSCLPVSTPPPSLLSSPSHYQVKVTCLLPCFPISTLLIFVDAVRSLIVVSSLSSSTAPLSPPPRSLSHSLTLLPPPLSRMYLPSLVMSSSSPKLHSIKASGCDSLSSHTLFAIASHLPHCQTFDFSKCVMMKGPCSSHPLLLLMMKMKGSIAWRRSVVTYVMSRCIIALLCLHNRSVHFSPSITISPPLISPLVRKRTVLH